MSAKVSNNSKEVNFEEFEQWLDEAQFGDSEFVRPNELTKVNMFLKAMTSDNARLDVLINALDGSADKAVRYTLKNEIVAKNVSIVQKQAWLIDLFNRMTERKNAEKFNTAMLECARIPSMTLTLEKKQQELKELSESVWSVMWDLAHLENLEFDMINASDAAMTKEETKEETK